MSRHNCAFATPPEQDLPPAVDDGATMLAAFDLYLEDIGEALTSLNAAHGRLVAARSGARTAEMLGACGTLRAEATTIATGASILSKRLSRYANGRPVRFRPTTKI